MELCDGDLHNLLKKKHSEDEQDTKWMVSVIKDTAKAMDQLADIPVIHRNIKPENFLIKGNVVKLTYFGLAVLLERGQGCYGTIGFVAPEVIVSDKEKTGMWSLGVNLRTKS